ncbi:MAG: hypothetical protein AB7O26_02820 [Planctomycetaceae bacterium]
MKNWFTSVAAIAVVAGAGVLVAAELKSGLQVGSEPPAFEVKDATGPAAGTTLCYRCRYGGSPVVTIFTRKIDDNVTSLIKKVDEQVAKNGEKKMKAFVVLLTNDPDKAEPMLKQVAEKNKIKNVPLTIFDGPKGPSDYELSDDANLTVMMWVKSDVKVNHAFADGKFDAKAVDAVVKDTQKILN